MEQKYVIFLTVICSKQGDRSLRHIILSRFCHIRVLWLSISNFHKKVRPQSNILTMSLSASWQNSLVKSKINITEESSSLNERLNVLKSPQTIHFVTQLTCSNTMIKTWLCVIQIRLLKYIPHESKMSFFVLLHRKQCTSGGRRSLLCIWVSIPRWLSATQGMVFTAHAQIAAPRLLPDN